MIDIHTFILFYLPVGFVFFDLYFLGFEQMDGNVQLSSILGI